MPRWSRKQDEYLMEHCNEGAERIADAMRNRFGVSRTAEAVRRHAYRIGAPIVVYEVCPSCGGKFEHLLHTGICYLCNQRSLAERQRCIQDEIRKNQSHDARRLAEREYERERARTSRLKRRA